MSRRNVVHVVVAFALGAMTVLIATAQESFDPKTFYAGRDPKEASAALLAKAEMLAGKGTWERIAVGHVAYLSGDKAKGEALFNAVLAGKVAKSDLYRIATAYAMAKEWDKAKPLFERAIAMNLEDDEIVNAACWFNLAGDRARAEELFTQLLGRSPRDFWDYVVVAGSYVGVPPFWF